MAHKGCMNVTRFYYGIKRMPPLLCLFVTLFGCLSTQGYGQQSLFDRLTDERFILDRQHEDEYDADEELEAEDEYDSDKNAHIETEKNAQVATGAERDGHQTEESLPQQPDKAPPVQVDETVNQQTDEFAKQQTDEADNQQKAEVAAASGSGVQQNDTAKVKQTDSERDYFLRYVHSVRKGARISAGISGRGYMGYLQLESPMPVPYFELSVRNFGVGLYPLAALQSSFPEKPIPTLFLGAGSLTFDSFLKTAQFSGFSKTKASYGGLTFPKEQFIGIGIAQKAIQYGVELYGEGWNGAFFASPEPQKQRMRYGVMAGWRMSPKKADINTAIQCLTAFVPELVREVKPSSVPSTGGGASAGQPAGSSTPSLALHAEYARQRYHTLFGLHAVFTHPIVSFATTGFCSYAADKTVSGAVQAEIDTWYRYAGVRTGGSYTGARAINWDGKQQTEQVTAFIQPYCKIGIFSLSTLYAFSMEERKILHTGGVTAHVKHSIVRWKASWDYRNELHTIKSELACVSKPAWFSGVRWFKKAAVGSSVELQNRATNPFIIKKYTVYANSSFCITDGVFCAINGSFSQAIQKEENKYERLIYLQSPEYGGGVSVSFKRNGIDKVHSGTLEVSAKNKKPYFDIKLGYQIRGK